MGENRTGNKGQSLPGAKGRREAGDGLGRAQTGACAEPRLGPAPRPAPLPRPETPLAAGDRRGPRTHPRFPFPETTGRPEWRGPGGHR